MVSVFLDDLPPAAYRLLEQPLLVMYGARTTVAGRRMAELLAEAVPHAELEVFANAGHMAPLTRARHVLARIELNFLRAVTAEGRR